MARPARTDRDLPYRLAVNFAFGGAVAVATLGGLLATDAQGLRTLILADEHPLLVLALLSTIFVAAFGTMTACTVLAASAEEPE